MLLADVTPISVSMPTALHCIVFCRPTYLTENAVKSYVVCAVTVNISVEQQLFHLQYLRMYIGIYDDFIPNLEVYELYQEQMCGKTGCECKRHVSMSIRLS